eukprot:gene1234-2392_t
MQFFAREKLQCPRKKSPETRRINEVTTFIDDLRMATNNTSEGVEAHTGKSYQQFSSILFGDNVSSIMVNEVLSEIFAATVAAFGQSIAHKSATTEMTYSELDECSNKIAQGLIKLGLGPGSVVGLWMPRGVDVLIAQIGITKTGAAWLPFDADAPPDRVQVCLKDADCGALITTDEFKKRLHTSDDFLSVTSSSLTLLAESCENDYVAVPPRPSGLTPDHPAYLIYTSGTTGVPKGIVITHRNVCHYLRSCNHLYGLNSSDVMFQGASIAFDLSVEEIWLPYLVGATLWVTSSMICVDLLADTLIEAGVTAIDTVPTLLTMFSKDIPSLRILLLGGEALPASVLQKWSKPGRRIFNTYGPTEATIVATVAELNANSKVTIGRPIPNYSCYIVDPDTLSILPHGTQGELLIGGPGVAQGYMKRPELTQQKFIKNPFYHEGQGITCDDPILYRSGDGASIDEQTGDIIFHGRIDDQVKIRGFRVELGEIESHLDAQACIAQAAVVLRRDEANMECLVAFIVLEPSFEFNRNTVRQALSVLMPPYMVPSCFQILETLPRLSASGKVDKKALKAIEMVNHEADTGAVQIAPEDEMQAKVLRAAQIVLPNQSISFNADLFDELGFHSLMVSLFVSALRKENSELGSVSFQDVYQSRTLGALAFLLKKRAQDTREVGSVARDFYVIPPPWHRRFLCGLAQMMVLPFILSLHIVQWTVLFLAGSIVLVEEANYFRNFFTTAYVTIVGYIGVIFLVQITVIVLKWIVIGRTVPGRYPLWGSYHFRVWFVNSMIQASGYQRFEGSPLLPWFLYLLGARIHSSALIPKFDAGAVDLITLGDNVVLGNNVKLSNTEASGNEFVVGAITIGDYSNIGTSVVIGSNVDIGSQCKIENLTYIPDNTVILDKERWEGSPGRRVELNCSCDIPRRESFDNLAISTLSSDDRKSSNSSSSKTSVRIRSCTHFITYLIGYFVLLFIELLPIFPTFSSFEAILEVYYDNLSEEGYHAWEITGIFVWPVALMYILSALALAVVVRWLVMPFRLKPGQYPVQSFLYFRMWFVGKVVSHVLDSVQTISATLYMPMWYKLLGAHIGKGCEISTKIEYTFDLITIGDHSFIGDDAIICEDEVENGTVSLSSLSVANRVFIGNAAIIPGGSILEEGALVGVLSMVPSSKIVHGGESYFGSPPIKLSKRSTVQSSAKRRLTETPSRFRYYTRLIFEFLILPTPLCVLLYCGFILSDLIYEFMYYEMYGEALAIFFSSGIAIGIVCLLVVLVIKWVWMQRFTPGNHYLWSFYAVRNEGLQHLVNGLLSDNFLKYISGTPMLPIVLRLFGCKIGKNVYLASFDMPEFDCVEIGDNAVINECSLQTHTFEDRVSKIGTIKIGKGVYIGSSATVLYNTAIGDYAQIASFSCVMIGETINAHSNCVGNPIVFSA